MKAHKSLLIVSWIFAPLTILLSIVLSFIQFHALFIARWSVCESPALEFIKIFFRILVFFAIMASCVMSLLTLTKQPKLLLLTCFLFLASIFSTILSFFLYDWFISLPLLGLELFTAIPLGIYFLQIRKAK